ncbi:MAG TPA: serine/threonine-protein kinase [Blastocatellia bacterium]|nr:serine/threonine-protein kinase [Blastocatellia bacterium]
MLDSGAILQNRYSIVRQIAQGGMGRVYLAEDRRFRNSQVALKEALCWRADTRKAFEREAELLHQLRHPALPHVTDYFIEDDKQYLVMQFIPGMTLEELLEERRKNGDGPFATKQVLQWTGQLLDALEYLHARHQPIIHRDIKPQNLKLTPRGEVILLDFGLAKGAGTESSQASESIRGFTRHYSSLEQIEGKGTDPRSDLYALAATLYRLLTGAHPPDALTRASAVLLGLPDPLLPADKLNPQVWAAVASAISCALSQNPDGRPRTAREMREALPLEDQPDLIDSSACARRWTGGRSSCQSFERPELSITSVETVPNLESTFAGQAIATDDFGHTTATQPERAPTCRGRRTAGIARTVRAIIGVAILVSAASAYRHWDSNTIGSGARPELSSDPSLSRTERSTPAASDEMAEMMSCSLESEKAGKVVPINTPLRPGELFRLRFRSRRSGYLYLIGLNANNLPTAFLTSRPNSGWGVKTNRIEAGDEFSFPPSSDDWLRSRGEASVESYLILFAPAPLDTPDFLKGPAGRNLAPAEVETLRQQYARGTRAELNGDQIVVSTPAKSVAEPFAFDIGIRIKRP